MLEVGSKVPKVVLECDKNGTLDLSDLYKKSPLILFFYPKDMTPGCTREACAFQEQWSKFNRAGAQVVGISPDSTKSHAKFREKYGLNYPLLSDGGHKVAEAFGVWVEKKNYGKVYMGIQRSTFIIDTRGNLAHAWLKVSVDGHVDDVLAQLKILSK
jgi:thioredoxin-dependent peroxiredoxin